MTKQESREHWLAKFNGQLDATAVYRMGPLETEIFKGAFELGWDAAENEMKLILAGGAELDEFGRTDEQLEFEINDLRERSV